MEENHDDEWMRRVLMDAVKMDWADSLNNAPQFQPSKKFQLQMKAMLKDPFQWQRKKMIPFWKKATTRAAAILITITVGVGSVMIASPTVRASVIKWFIEWYETHVEYRYSGEPIQTELPQYYITNLPEGYVEMNRLVYPEYVSVTYGNVNQNTLYLDYAYLQEGTVSSFETGDMDIMDITVNGCPGQLFLSKDTNQTNAITWIDNQKNIQFTIDGFQDKSELLHMAENISLMDSTK